MTPTDLLRLHQRRLFLRNAAYGLGTIALGELLRCDGRAAEAAHRAWANREALARYDQAMLAAERAGEVCVWGGGGASTTLSFVYARDREDDGVIEALLAAVGAVWQLAAARSLPRRLRPVG